MNKPAFCYSRRMAEFTELPCRAAVGAASTLVAHELRRVTVDTPA